MSLSNSHASLSKGSPVVSEDLSIHVKICTVKEQYGWTIYSDKHMQVLLLSTLTKIGVVH